MLLYQSPAETLTYDQLLISINNAVVAHENYYADSYVDFITNNVIALLHGVDISLVDYRNHKKPQETISDKIEPLEISSISDLVERLQQSTSKVNILSSGTTGTPKLIGQTIARLLKSVRISEEYTHSRWAFTYNPAHSAGFQVFLQAIANQATLYDLYKCPRVEIIDTIIKNQITHLSATPTFYRMLAPYDFEFSSIKSVTFNGEKSSKELIDSITKVCPLARIRNIYGSTESGPLMSSDNTIFKVSDRMYGKVKIENGELLIHSDLISKSIKDTEWYHTGDMVKVVAEQPLTIEFLTRKTKIINVGGQNVNPQEVEEHLINHPNVQDTKVYGRKNRMIGNLIVAEVQTFPQTQISEKELITYCKSHLVAYKVPRMIKFVDKIEVGRTGKK